MAWGLPLVGVNHLEGHLVAAWLEHGDLELPLVTLLVSGGPHPARGRARRRRLRAARLDDRRRGGGGLRQGRALPRARLPRGPGDRPARRRGRPRRPALPAPAARRRLRRQLLGAEDRGRPRRRRRTRAPGGRRGRELPGGRRRGARRQVRRAPSRRWVRAPSPSAGASRRTARCEPRSPSAADTTGRALRAAVARVLHRQRGDDRRGRRSAASLATARAPSRCARTPPWRWSSCEPRARRTGHRPARGLRRGGAARPRGSTPTRSRSRPRPPRGDRARAWCCCAGSPTSGVRFFTNYESRKGAELAANPRCGGRLVRRGRAGARCDVEGTASELSAAASDAYFASRDRGHQLGAVASRQSSVLEDRADARACLRSRRGALRGRRRRAPACAGAGTSSPRRMSSCGSSATTGCTTASPTTASADGWRVDRLAP